jgi:predicted amidophosphoribosyltransferase
VPIARIQPVRLWGGTWDEGFALDYHTRGPWDARTEVGSLVYELKYSKNWNALQPLVETAEHFIRIQWEGLPRLDLIVPAPPSVLIRGAQPVLEIARELATRLESNLCENAVAKTRATQEMKYVRDWGERHQILREAIQKGTASVLNKRVLVLDDVTQSQATLRRVTNVLQATGASEVYAFALTRTK